jgi:hypothetical protein
MHMGVDHVPDRPVAALPDRREEAAAGLDAAAGVDDRDHVPPDHEAEIGDRARIVGRRERDGRLVHEDPGCDFPRRERARPGRGRGSPGRPQGEAERGLEERAAPHADTVRG